MTASAGNDSLVSGYQAYSRNKYFRSLDGVRFFSIMAVIWHHSYPEGTASWLLKGFLGVDMFFVLSGYLIVTLLLREKDRGEISLKDFYIRRSLRIFPVYFGLLLGLGVIYGVVKNDSDDFNLFFSLLPIYLFFVANWSLAHIPNLEIYWSLATEEQFYLLWPLLERLLRRKTVFIILCIFIAINQLVNFGLLDGLLIAIYGTEEVIHLSIIDSTFTPICLGVLLAHGLHRQTVFERVYPWLRGRMTPLALFVVLLGIIFTSPDDISGHWRLFIQVAMFVWLASLVIRENHCMQPVMSVYPVKRIGQISYGMYVYHMFALHIGRLVLEKVVLEKFGFSFDLALFLVGSVITIIMAELSFRFYESPILNLKKKFSH